MKKKLHKDQLVFDFSSAVAEFKNAADNLANSFERLSSSNCTTVQKTEAKNILVEEVSIVRARMNRVVKLKARTLNLHWREVWRIAYERLRRQTGFDAVARGLSRGIIPLAAVCKAGYEKRRLEITTAI